MRRSLLAFIVVVLPLALAVEAAGKVAIKQAEVCRGSECVTRTMSGANGALAFKLFGPTIEVGRRTPPPARSDGPRYRVTLTTQPIPGREVISLDYFPDAGYIHVLGRPGAEAGGASLNTGWVRLEPGELGAYDRLTSGLGPPDAEASGGGDGDGAPWLTIGAIAAAVALGALVVVLTSRRRGASSPSGLADEA